MNSRTIDLTARLVAQRPRVPLRDRVASVIIFAAKRIATDRFEQRLTRSIATGNPNGYVTVDEAVLDV